ncbi:protein FAM162A-like isoform X2 [Ornithorhynchus anatinus]|uniref:protein FAM162A-like isoform X2 n=1 Tax=Ornithorhynchus anatinus TaxID=9258 RepID=UPI0010A87038|nr:protein FAM162A-like isoform X2 [Ornithorhynchus anatinus]
MWAAVRRGLPAGNAARTGVRPARPAPAGPAAGRPPGSVHRAAGAGRRPPPPTRNVQGAAPQATSWEKKVLVWSGRFKKEDEIPEAITFEMLDAAKNKFRVKISYAMMALTVMGCVLMIIKGKQAARRHESLTSMNLEKKARLREEAAALQDHK